MYLKKIVPALLVIMILPFAPLVEAQKIVVLKDAFQNEMDSAGASRGFNMVRGIEDPLEHYVDTWIIAFERSKPFLVVTSLDIDGDGDQDMLITNGHARTAYMIFSWTMYLKDEDGYIFLEAAPIMLNPNCFYFGHVEELDRKAIVNCSTIGRDIKDSVMYATYLSLKGQEVIYLVPIDPPKGYDKEFFTQGMFGRLGEGMDEISFRYISYQMLEKEYAAHFEKYRQRQ